MDLPAGMHVLERGWLSSNNILFVDAQQTALVDSGYLSHAPQTLALVQHTLQGRALDLLINTHLHSDHCGGNALLQRTYACRTLIPHADTHAVAAWDHARLPYESTGQACEQFTFDGSINDGDELVLAGLRWQVLAAPGHDPHSMVLYCPQEGILISADALWEHGFGVIFPELEGESGFAEQAAILQRIQELDVRLVIPGHGAPFSDVSGALDRARSRLDYLSADTRRNARNALKVMLAFLLLDKQELYLPAIAQELTRNRIMRASAAQLEMPAEALIPQLAQELVRAGVARLEGERLINTG
ncbi:MBL fold metallo-hydrolase [Undibacterium sp. SXout7W]|uniref:MBL fold metallo-hydrolase n=1 Tax=Undibacterium sp. SXout7W TaxID=3413049 RepID=UPI003BF0B3BB